MKHSTEARRAGIFVENGSLMNTKLRQERHILPVHQTLTMSLLTELGKSFSSYFYKYAAPTALMSAAIRPVVLPRSNTSHTFSSFMFNSMPCSNCPRKNALGTVRVHRKKHKDNELCKRPADGVEKNSRMMGGQFTPHLIRVSTRLNPNDVK
jgi:hypothetical protein